MTGSNAFMVNQGSKKKTVISNSMLTSAAGALKAASKAGSYGVTGQPASAMALSGSANGRIQIARVSVWSDPLQVIDTVHMGYLSRTASDACNRTLV